MKYRLALTCIMAMLLSAVFTGCGAPKVYYYNFKDEQDLANEEGTWSFAEAGTYLFIEKGIRLDNNTLCCPLMFSGDLTVTWGFWLNCEDTPSNLSLEVALREGSRYANWLNICFPSIGHVYRDDVFSITDRKPNTDTNVPIVYSEPTLGFDYLGFNVLTLTRNGDHFSLIINDILNAEFDLQYYESRWFGPVIAWDLWEGIGYTGEEAIVVESITVTYSGSAVPLIMYNNR